MFTNMTTPADQPHAQTQGRCGNPYCDGTGWISVDATATTNAHRVPACNVGPHPQEQQERGGAGGEAICTICGTKFGSISRCPLCEARDAAELTALRERLRLVEQERDSESAAAYDYATENRALKRDNERLRAVVEAARELVRYEQPRLKHARANRFLIDLEKSVRAAINDDHTTSADQHAASGDGEES